MSFKCALTQAFHLLGAAEIDKESWALSMSKLLSVANQYKHRYQGLLIPRQIRERFRCLYDSIVTRGLNYHKSLKPLQRKNNRGRKKRRAGHNLLIRLRDYKKDVLRFLEKPEVPFTNNQAERDLRMFKVKMNSFNLFKILEWMNVHARIRSFIYTAHKQNTNILENLTLAHTNPISVIHLAV